MWRAALLRHTRRDRRAVPAPEEEDRVAAEIEPDTKDWTWVLSQPCPECGFDAAKVDPTAIGATVRTLVPRWQAALARDDVRDRPQPATWSTLEYGAHVRDVFRVMDQRLELLLDQDDPQFANWDQDATAVAERYGEQDPALVAQQLGAAAVVLADRYDSVPSDAWQRPGRRSNGSVFTVDTLGRYMLHDVLHHLHDVHA